MLHLYEICSYLPYSIARFRPRPIIKLFPARCSCGNQVTRLVNRMEVLSEELHPSWQYDMCVRLETSVSWISLSSTVSLHNHVCYLLISQWCSPENSQFIIIFLIGKIQEHLQLVLILFVFLSWLPVCLCSWIHKGMCCRWKAVIWNAGRMSHSQSMI